ncbi:hypothetical protein P167DRAFT_546983 [Morchella conica CCBAS932]|uniref:Uncharacterized protein n=1 Tax=Morchella conica CCBAS932 TaxID=1392247 RepID=A0A3N4KY36_9PEZI|nr:hypothetical protein P167DRAFT_546983 [Morchella conica CCBAS932]
MSSLPLNTNAAISGILTSAANVATSSNGPPPANPFTRRRGSAPPTIVAGGPPNSSILPRNTSRAKATDTAKRRIRWLGSRMIQLERRQRIREAYGDSLMRQISNEQRNTLGNQLPTEFDKKYIVALDTFGHENEQQIRVDAEILENLDTELSEEMDRAAELEHDKEMEDHFAKIKRMIGDDGEGIGKKQSRIVFKRS